MYKKFSELPLRNGVGIVVLNRDNKVFVAKRIDNPRNFWQMPQGGVDKGKLEKAKKRYEKAQALLIKSNKKKPLQPDTLNYLGFTTRKLGDYENGEKYYLLGLEINPNHVGINEYLGELYVVTNRLDLAKERLKVLENCNCKEYKELKEIIDGTINSCL